MKSFTGIIFWSILLICSACTDENETNNGKRTDCYNGTPLTVRATATGFENIPGSEKPSTRASVTDEHLKIDKLFWENHGKIIENNSRGYGYWLWKPYIVKKQRCVSAA